MDLEEKSCRNCAQKIDYLDYNGWKQSYEQMVMAAEALYEYEREERQLKYLEEKEKENGN
jgi:hypothetical protein